jgi:predicted nucleic acid-binding Zn ribbon protein
MRRDEGTNANRPRAIAEALADLLRATGLDADVARAAILEQWAAVVGAQIASVTQPRMMTEDGTLVVGVRTHGWMTELSMMERQLLAKLNATQPAVPVRKIRLELLR